MEPDLASLYSNQVQPRGVVCTTSTGSSFGTQIERDPNLVNLENSVFSQLFELVKEEKPPKPAYKQNELKVVSYEEALKELLELEKNNNH
jgi:hypothetical protein